MRKLLLAALLASPLASFAGGNLLTDGGFEDAAVGAGSYAIFNGTSVPGWTAGNEIEVRYNVAGTAEEGHNYVELDANSNSSMSQSFATVVGGVYDLSFYYSNRAGTDAATNGLTFSAGSLSGTAPLLAANNTGDNVWSLYSTTFTATSTTTTLAFAAAGTSDSYGSSLDNISVTAAVPEPETYALMLAGLAAMGYFVRRRRV